MTKGNQLNLVDMVLLLKGKSVLFKHFLDIITSKIVILNSVKKMLALEGKKFISLPSKQIFIL